MTRIFKASFYYLVLASLIVLGGCNSKNPAPELVDPLYLELEKEKKSAEADVKAAEEALAVAEDNMKKVVPQTGQIKYAAKRLNEAKNRLIQTKQYVQYFDVKIESRKWAAREEYLKSYYGKSPWPRQEPLETFLLNKTLGQTPKEWSAKKRREMLGFPTQSTQTDRDPATANPPTPAAH